MLDYEKLAVGTKLRTADQRHVLAAYVHRFTGDNKPSWARMLRSNGEPHPLQFKDDADWLAHTEFQITKSGALDKRVKECCSTPTWPDTNGKHPQ